MGNENTESGQVAGAAGQPNQQASQTSGTSTSSVDVEALKGVLIPFITEEVAKQSQSIKDKRIAKLSGDVKSVLSRLDELTSEGWSQKQAIRLMEIEERQQLAGHDDQEVEAEVPVKGKTGTQTQPAGVDTAALVKLIGLDANSPEVLAVIRDHSDDTLAQLSALTDLGQKKRAVQQAPANAAQIMSSGGGATAPDQIETLNSRLSELMKSPTQNLTEINKVQAELEKLVRSPH